MLQENQKLAKKVYELFNSNKIEELSNLFTENAKAVHIPTNTVFNGPAGFRDASKIWKTAFSDAKCELKNQIVNDDYIVTEFNGVGVHDGVLSTPMGNVPATGKKINIPFVEILKVKNGKIESSKLYFDTATMMHQLELIPEKV